MKKLFNYAFMMLAMASVSTIATSCGDDDNTPVYEQFNIVGKWSADYTDPEETSEAVLKLENYVTFNADKTYEDFNILPADVISKLPENQQARYDKDGVHTKTRGTYVLRNDSLITYETDVCCYEEYNDWEWHKCNCIEAVALSDIKNDSFTASAIEGGVTHVVKFKRVK